MYCNNYVIGAQKLAHVNHQNVSNYQNSVCHESIYILKGICRNRCTAENDDADLHVPQAGASSSQHGVAQRMALRFVYMGRKRK